VGYTTSISGRDTTDYFTEYLRMTGAIQELAAHQLQVLLMGGDPYQARGVAEWRPLPRVA
jgi:hypothetical protein